jgi:hypothetical protein
MDFHAKVGDPVMAVAEGVVSFAGVKGGYGNVVDVDHGNGYVTRYAHNSRLVVKAGDLVRAGQEVAKAGSTGRSTGAHVHFEVWENGNVVNPRKFLGDGGNTPVGRQPRLMPGSDPFRAADGLRRCGTGRGPFARRKGSAPRLRPATGWVETSAAVPSYNGVAIDRAPGALFRLRRTDPKGRPGVVSIQPGSFNDQQPAYPRIWQS